MLKNYLKISWRNLMKDKTFTLLNVIGLSVAFGVAILLAMAAFFDLSFDKFHENEDTVYKVYTTEQTTKGQEAGTSNAAPLAVALKTEVPGVDKISRYLEDGTLVTYNNKEINMDAVWVDADFFSILSFPSVKGNLDGALKNKSSVAITEKIAEILFGKEEPIGKTINLVINGEEEPFTIGTVIKNIPSQSEFDFDIAVRFENHREYSNLKDRWDSKFHEVYVQLNKEVSATQFETNTRSFTNLHYAENIANAKRDGASPDSNGQYQQIRLLPLKDVHFTSLEKGFADTSRTYPYLILGIAFLILFIACVNFVNMSIARSGQRLREIGMRKTLGAQKAQLFFQFWSESLFVFMISLIIGVTISVLLLNDFKTIFRTGVSFDIITPFALTSFITFIIGVTVLVGGYPAIVLSKLGTIQALKGKLETSGKNRVRDGLMIIQFGIAILLISGTLVLWGQLEFMRNKNLGYNKEQVVAFPLDGKKNSYRAVQLLREELAGNPDILGVTASDNILGLGKDGTTSSSTMSFDYKGHTVKTNVLTVDYDYVKTLDMQLVSGRNFDKKFAADSLSLVVNETMARQLEEKDPLTARIILDDSIAYSVIGVVKDYNFKKLNQAIEPITMFMNKDWDVYYAYVKIAPENKVASFAAIKNAWANIEPNVEFLGSFLDENVDRTFRREKIMTTMISSGSVIAIILSCIGLFAISLLVVAQRTKEIGVRKVVGASVTSITFMLTKDFLKLVFISFVIASPIAWWFMKEWLLRYAYRIELNIWYFVGAGILAVLIALLTVGAKTIKAAMQNPVKSLRTE